MSAATGSAAATRTAAEWVQGFAEGSAGPGRRGDLLPRARLAGGRRVTLHTVDRITLRGGVAVERVAHLDPLELLGPVALSPRAWPAFARIQAAGLRERIDR